MRVIALMSVGLCLAQSVAHADGNACSTLPKQAVVCDSGIVSKEKLANYALDACGVSRNLEAALLAAGRVPAIGNLTVAERMLAADVCKTGATCKPEDKTALVGADTLVDVVLNDSKPAYVNSAGEETPADFFTNPSAVLTCGKDPNGKPIEAPGATPTPKGWTPSKRLRIRGSTDTLFFSNDDPQFGSVDKANVTSSYSNANSTRTDKILATVGFAAIDPEDNSLYGLIPYAGVNRNLSRPAGKAVSVTADTVDFGLLNSFVWRIKRDDDQTINWVTVRPDFLVNHKDDSHLATLSVIDTPIHNCPVCFNAYRQLFNFLELEPILDGRSDVGYYSQRGDNAKTDYKNYWRLGPRAGFSLSSSYPYLPMDLTVTDVFEEGISGSLPHINYFKSVLSYRLIGKNISLDLSFSNGRREDTGEPEHLWSVGLSGAY
jgi:hypothetical protein